MTKRSYDQFCPLAKALDILGERWTLLIIRELLVGPARYSDLSNSLPGIGTNLLATRLRDLESHGLVRRRELPPPAASTVYELTEDGEELREPVLALGRFGLKHLEPQDLVDGCCVLPARAAILGLPMALEQADARDLTATFRLEISGQPYTLSMDAGRPTFSLGAPPSTDAVIRIERPDLLRVAMNAATLQDIEAEGKISIEGDRAAAERLLEIIDYSWLIPPEFADAALAAVR